MLQAGIKIKRRGVYYLHGDSIAGVVMRRKIAAIFGLIVGGCAAEKLKKPEIPTSSWESVLQDEGRMDGHEISICGWFDAEFEICTLTPSPYGSPELAAASTIWVVPTSDICSLEKVAAQPIKGWANISGIFQSSKDPGRGFGQFGMFRYAIGKARIKLQETSCDK